MTSTEIILATFQNLKTGMGAVAFIACMAFSIGAFILILGWSDIRESSRKKAIQLLEIVIAIAVLSGIFTIVPSVDDIWKVRIGLIKLQLASPENIQKGSEEIIRIGKKLECKYVGCGEEKESKNGKKNSE